MSITLEMKQQRHTSDSVGNSSRIPTKSDEIRPPIDSSASHNYSQRHLGNRSLQAMAKKHLFFAQGRGKNGELGIQRKCDSLGACANCTKPWQGDQYLQRKVTVGPARDVFEQEADQVAEQVMRIPGLTRQEPQNPTATTNVRIQRRVTPMAKTHSTALDITLPNNGGQPLSQSTRQYMEPRFGTDFSHVRVHSNQAARDTASQIQAKAFTSGPNIWLGKGAQENDTRLMAHELTHVVQQDNRYSHISDIQRTVEVTPDATAADDILSQFRFLCSDVNFDRKGTTITGDSSSIATKSCECISDVVGDPDRIYTIDVVSITNTPAPETLHDGSKVTIPIPSTGPSTLPGVNPTITMPSSKGSAMDFGLFKADGSAFVAPNWRILAHEICGHSRLNQSYAGSKGNRPGHDKTIDTENTIAGEHGGEVRGHFADTRQGESFHNPSANNSKVVFKLTDGWHFEAP